MNEFDDPVQNLYAIDESPVLRTDINTSFGYDIMDPRTIRSATGLVFDRLHLSILAAAYFVNDTFSNMEEAQWMLYYPMLLLSEIGLHYPVPAPDIFKIKWNCMIHLNGMPYIKVPKGDGSIWYPVSHLLGGGTALIQKTYDKQEDTLLYYMENFYKNVPSGQNYKMIIALMVACLLDMASKTDKGKWIINTYHIGDPRWIDPDNISKEDLNRIYQAIWQVSTENLLLQNSGKSWNDPDMKKYLFGTE